MIAPEPLGWSEHMIGFGFVDLGAIVILALFLVTRADLDSQKLIARLSQPSVVLSPFEIDDFIRIENDPILRLLGGVDAPLPVEGVKLRGLPRLQLWGLGDGFGGLGLGFVGLGFAVIDVRQCGKGAHSHSQLG